MRARVTAWLGFGVVLAAYLFVRPPGGSPAPAPLRWGPEPPRLSGAGSPEAGLIRSIEVMRPAPVELRVIESPPFEAVGQYDPPPSCDAAPLALLRAGCPSAPPAVSACSDEGLECRYEGADGCAERHECVHGWWTPVPEDCPESEAAGLLLQGAGACSERLPIADAPCADEAVVCGYLPCFIGSMPEVEAECRCGRWYLSWGGCPID